MSLSEPRIVYFYWTPELITVRSSDETKVLREPPHVAPPRACEHGLASEFGEWVERWREPSGNTELRRTYYALWGRQNCRCLIEGEVNVT